MNFQLQSFKSTKLFQWEPTLFSWEGFWLQWDKDHYE